MKKFKLLIPIGLMIGLFLFSCSDDEEDAVSAGSATSGGNQQDTMVVSSDGYALITEDTVGDATWFVPGQQGRVPGGLDGTKLEYLYNDTADEVTFRITVVNLMDFSTSPSFDLSFQLPNGTVPVRTTGSPFRGTTLTHRTASVYTDNGGMPPSTYSYNQTNQFAINGISHTGGFSGNTTPFDTLKSICEGCVDFRLDVSNKQIYATIDRNLIIKNEEIDTISNSATIKLVANVGYQRSNNDIIADGEEFTIKIVRDSTMMDTTVIDMLPAVATNSVNSVTQTSAVVSGIVSDTGSSAVVTRGICYSLIANPTINDSVVSSGNGLGSYSATLQNLKLGTSYYARAFATSSVGTAYGSQAVFKTLKKDTTPTVTTNPVTLITNTTARLNATIVENGNRPILRRGFVVSEMPNFNVDSNFRDTIPGSALGNYGTGFGILRSNTIFYVRAYATNDLGTAYGAEIQFTTTDSVRVPTIFTTTVINITQTSALCGVNVYDNGNADMIEVGLVYSTSPNPTLSDNVLPEFTVDPGNRAYGVLMSNLSSGTKYYVRAYGKNSVGTSYGRNEFSFTTNP